MNALIQNDVPFNNFSPWQSILFREEQAFADRYDREEFEVNAALRIMKAEDELFMRDAFSSLTREKAGLLGNEICVAGTGTGREVLILRAAGAAVEGIDLAPRYVEITQEKLLKYKLFDEEQSRVNLCCSPLEQYFSEERILSALKNKFDGISSLFGVLNHIEDWEGMLERFYSTLKPGGVLVFSMYGPNEARVFDLMRNGELTYEPSIVQRRVGNGIVLGDKASEVLPASFPDPETIARKLKSIGFEIKACRGFLNFTALFPRDETKTAEFKKLIGTLDPILDEILKPISDPAELLEATAEYDQTLATNSKELTKFAYIGFIATKPEVQ